MNDTESRRFHLGDLLSVTTGILLSPDHVGGIYNVVDFVTGQAHMTHQLPRACGEVAPYLLEQHPWLSDVEVPELSGESEVMAWLAVASKEWGEWHEVSPMPPGQYVGRDPIAELREMSPGMRIIGVVPPEA